MTAFLKKTFIHQLNKLDWMDPGTKERAIRKANAIEYKSGYPATLFNDSWMHANWGFVSFSVLVLDVEKSGTLPYFVLADPTRTVSRTVPTHLYRAPYR